MTVRISAQQSIKHQAAAAGWLFDHVIERRDRIALIAESSPAYLAITLGALRSGVIPVLISPTLSEHEQAELIKDCDPTLVLRDADLDQLVEWPGARRAALAPVPLARPTFYTSRSARNSSPAAGDTSPAGGASLGVASGQLSEVHARALLMDESEQWGFNANDINLVVSPLDHWTSMSFAIGTLMAGGDVVIPGSFDVTTLRAAIKQYRPTTAFTIPTDMERLFADGGELPSLSSFRLLAHGGAPCPDQVRMEAARWLPRGALWEFYGSVEGHFTACSFDEWTQRPGTVGKARRLRKLSIDAATGVIWCKAPAHARFEYWGHPDATAAAWRENSFSVGDTGRLDKDGYLFLDDPGSVDVLSDPARVEVLDDPASVDTPSRWAPPVGVAAANLPDPTR